MTKVLQINMVTGELAVCWLVFNLNEWYQKPYLISLPDFPHLTTHQALLILPPK